MHKIVLIEDRRSRMEIYLENGESDVDKLSKLEYLDLYGPDDAKNNISKSDYSFLQKYQLPRLQVQSSQLTKFKVL